MSYGNPFWRVPESFSSDSNRVNLARHVDLCLRRIDRLLGFQLLVSLPVWITAGILYLIDFRTTPRDEFGNYLNASGVEIRWWTSILLWLAVTISLGSLLLGLRFSYRWRAIRGRIYRESVCEYRAWLGQLSASNPTRHLEILRWEQAERQIQLQQQSVAMMQYQMLQQQQQRNDVQKMKKDVKKIRQHHER